MAQLFVFVFNLALLLFRLWWEAAQYILWRGARIVNVKLSWKEKDEQQQEIEGDETVKLDESRKKHDDAPVGPIHSVFLIHDILEEILGLMEFNELCRCRGVCSSWNLRAAPILQKRRTLYFGDYATFTGAKASRKLIALHPLQNPLENKLISASSTFKSKALSQLTKLLVNSKKLNLAKTFPYRKFKFAVHNKLGSPMTNLGDEVLQSFLDSFGMHIEELSICFEIHFRAFRSLESSILPERRLMELIENLLVHQAPSLSFLSLETPSRVAWEVDGESRGKMSSLRITDPEFQNIQQNLEGKRKSKLKFLHWTKRVSPKALEVIFQLAPELESVVLETGYEHMMVEPLNRQHLLRHLDVNPRNGSIQSLETFASACQGGMNRLYLQSICIRFCQCANCVQHEHWTSDLEKRIIRVINAIFAATHSPVLKRVDWFGSFETSLVLKINFSNVARSICKIQRLDDPWYRHSLVADQPLLLFPFLF